MTCYNILPTKNVGFCGKDNCLYDIKYDQLTRRILSIKERNKNELVSDENVKNQFSESWILGFSVWDILNLIKTDYKITAYYNFLHKLREYNKKVKQT